jgi:hypothetical protein
MNKAGDRLIAATSLVINNKLWFLHPCENICSVSSKKKYLFCSALYFLIKGSLCVCVLYVKSDGFVLFEVGRN